MDNHLAFAALGMALFNLAVLLIALDNRRAIPTLVSAPLSGRDGGPPVSPLVSILVPARKESRVIAPCLISLANQDYPDFEILVLDDHSTDQTQDITEKLSRPFPTIRLIPSESLPEGWLGKNWATHQLGRAAGEISCCSPMRIRSTSPVLFPAASA